MALVVFLLLGKSAEFFNMMLIQLENFQAQAALTKSLKFIFFLKKFLFATTVL